MPDRFEQARIQGEIGRSAATRDPFAAAVRATRMPMVITDPQKADNPIVFVNASFERLTGYSRDECVGRNCRFLQGPGTNPDDIDRLREAIANRTTVETEILNYRKDGSTFWNHVLVSPVFDDDGTPAFFFASQFDVTPERNRLAEVQRDRANLEHEIERRINDLARTEDRLRFTLGAGRLGAWTLDLKDRRLVSSTRCKENFGRGATDTFTYDDLISSIHPGDILRWREALDTALADHDGEFWHRVPPRQDAPTVKSAGRNPRSGEPGRRRCAGRHGSRPRSTSPTASMRTSIANFWRGTRPPCEEHAGERPGDHQSDPADSSFHGGGSEDPGSRIQALSSPHDVLLTKAWTSRTSTSSSPKP